ncbi:MAG: hypothetical protein FH761_17860 [Firmicutes bacterium]|nr:hypothetical protein [Bacillota bacterium]
MFKDTLQNDIVIFFNDFAEPHNIDGVTIDCIVDNDKLTERSKKEFDGLSLGDMLIYVKSEDLNKSIKEDMPIVFDNRPMQVFSSREDMGIYEIVLNQNVSG